MADDLGKEDRKRNQSQRVGRPHAATWAEAEIVLAADLGDGTDDPRATAPDLLRRALASLPERARASGRVALRADAGYFVAEEVLHHGAAPVPVLCRYRGVWAGHVLDRRGFLPASSPATDGVAVLPEIDLRTRKYFSGCEGLG